MLLYPSINTLNEKTDSRYSLVILTAKRARDIIDGKPALTEDECERPVSQAAKEVAGDMITYTRRAAAGPSAEEAAPAETETEEIPAEEPAETEEAAEPDTEKPAEEETNEEPAAGEEAEEEE